MVLQFVTVCYIVRGSMYEVDTISFNLLIAHTRLKVIIDHTLVCTHEANLAKNQKKPQMCKLGL